MRTINLPQGRLIRVTALRPQVRQATEGESGTIEGYAVQWNKPWNERMTKWFDFVEMFAPGAFRESIESNNGDIYASYQHDDRYILGRLRNETLELREDESGLFYRITPPGWANWITESIQRGDVDGSSFIFDYQDYEWQEQGDNKPPILLVTRAELYEVAPVTSPAYPDSEAYARGMKGSMEKILATMPSRLAGERARAIAERARQMRDLQMFNLGVRQM